MDTTGEQSSNLQAKVTRRQFLNGVAGLGIAAVTAGFTTAAAPAITPDQPQSPLSASEEPFNSPLQTGEQLKSGEVTLYNDLTPGIGIGVAWTGRTSTWNPIVENIIKATSSVNIAPYIFVPRYLTEDFNTFLKEMGLENGKYNLILCDPDYEISSDAAEMDTGKKAENIKRTGFISSWIRDWGSMIAVRGGETLVLNTRKPNVPDPLKGVDMTNMRTILALDPGLKFDGGAFADFRTNDGRSFFLGSENEFVNNNQGYFRQQLGKSVDAKKEAEFRLKNLFGQNLDMNLLPSLKGSSVDHTDMYCMPLGDNVVALGQALQDDPNYEVLESVRGQLSAKNLDLPRIPVRRRDNNIISWINVLPHTTKENNKYLFMPTYEGFEEENSTAEGVYKELGFEVVRVDSTTTLNKGGAVHCATNTSVTAPFIQGI